MSTSDSSTPSSDRWEGLSPYYFDDYLQQYGGYYQTSPRFHAIWNTQVEAPVSSQPLSLRHFDLPETQTSTNLPVWATTWPSINTAVYSHASTPFCPFDSDDTATTVRPTVASPRPVHAYNPLQDIENAIERFEGSPNNIGNTYSTANVQAPTWKLPCPDTLDGVPGHVGIVEHGPRLDGYRDCYTPPGLSYSDFMTYPSTSSGNSARTSTTTESFYKEPVGVPQLDNGAYGWVKSRL